ncbi:MAG: hemerythrin domain-containing protein [Actinobacteria bacterium]|nr:hemerythrin domain-containing protein [Actinomycetota bacterium]
MTDIGTGTSTTTSATDDVIAAVRRDHAEIKQLFARVEASKGDEQRDAFRLLVTKLAVHETAEEELVHPLLRKTPGGEAVLDPLLQQEDQAKKELAELEKIEPGSAAFEAKFQTIRNAVLQHAEQEEQQEHPRLEQDVDAERRRKLAALFRAAEASAPTHPHPNAPESATGNMVLGPFVAIADRVRDAIRDAREKA